MFRVATGTTNATLSGTSDFTVSGFGSVAGAIVYINAATSGSNPNTNPTGSISWQSCGYYDGTNQVSKCEASEDGLSLTTNAWKYSMTDKIGHYTNSAGTVQAEYSISAITDGVRITTDVTDSQAHQCMVILIPASGVANIKAFNTNWVVSPEHTVVETSVGFEADLLFNQGGVNPGPDNVDNSVQTGWGFVHNVDGTNANIVQMCTGMTINDGRDLSGSPPTQTTWTSTGSWDFYGLINLTNSGTPRYGIRFSDFTTSGFTMTKYTDENTNPPTTLITADFAAQEDTMHLAIKFKGTPNIRVFMTTAPSGTGSVSDTVSPGFQPEFGMMLTPHVPGLGVNSVTGVGDSQAVCAFDATTQATMGFLDQDNVGTTWCSAYLDAGGIQVYRDQNVSIYDASFTSFDTNGWTWNYTTADATSPSEPWPSLAIGANAAASPVSPIPTLPSPESPQGVLSTAGAYLITANPSKLQNNSFLYSINHAIEMIEPGTFSFVGNSFTEQWNTIPSSPDANQTTEAALLNEAGPITLNITDGDTPTVFDGGKITSPEAVTTLNNNISVTLTNLQPGTEVRVYPAQDFNSPNDLTQLDGVESTGSPSEFTFSAPAGTIVDIVVFNVNYVLPPSNRISNFVVPTSTTSFPVSQILDRNFSNP